MRVLGIAFAILACMIVLMLIGAAGSHIMLQLDRAAACGDLVKQLAPLSQPPATGVK